jgi:hypothetical protein
MAKKTRVNCLPMCLLAVVFTACAPAYNGPNRNPVISSFTLTPTTSLRAKLEMVVSDPDGDALTCTINDGLETTTLKGQVCSSTAGNSFNLEARYKQAGTYTATLQLEDGRGGNTTASTTVTIK